MLLTGPIMLAGMVYNYLTGGELGLPLLTVPGLLNFVTFLFMVNLSLLVFNMLPAFPMDGGRVLRALLAMKLSYGRATRLAVAGGRLFAVLFVVAGVLTGNIFLALVALFVFSGAGAEGQEVAKRDNEPRRLQFDPQVPVLLADTPAHLAFARLLRSHELALAVVDYGGQFVGLVTCTGMERSWAAGVRGPVSRFIERV